jgi:catechol 2,3-dioxygenase-like lactoylglutathione lyase family enzyme
VKLPDAAGLHHFALTVTDLERSKRFYTEALGFTGVMDVPGLALISGYGLLIGLHAEANGSSRDRFDPHRVGLDHLALPAAAADLDGLKQQLDASGVPNNGVQADEMTKARYICFYDPDGIPWELYAMPA